MYILGGFTLRETSCCKHVRIGLKVLSFQSSDSCHVLFRESISKSHMHKLYMPVPAVVNNSVFGKQLRFLVWWGSFALFLWFHTKKSMAVCFLTIMFSGESQGNFRKLLRITSWTRPPCPVNLWADFGHLVRSFPSQQTCCYQLKHNANQCSFRIRNWDIFIVTFLCSYKYAKLHEVFLTSFWNCMLHRTADASFKGNL